MARSRIMSLSAGIDGAALTVMLGAALAGFWPAFGGPAFLRPVLIGLVAGAGIAWLGAWRRWSAVTVVTATIGAYFLLGTAAGLWTHGIAQIIPTVDCLRTLVFSSVGVWKQFVTASTPLGSFYSFMLVPFILALVAAVAAFTAAWRSKPVLALIPIGVLTGAVILLGTTRPFFPTVQALCLALPAVAWLAWRAAAGGATRETGVAAHSRLLRGGALVLAAGLVAGTAGAFFAEDQDREVIRRHVVPPLNTQTYASPLVSYRNLVDPKGQGDATLFTVEGWNKDLLLRLAVMDTYDGMVYNVGLASGASRYDRVGPDLAGDSVTVSPRATPAAVTVTVDQYAGVWVPSVSQMETLTFTGARTEALTQALYYNPSADALIDPVGLGTGVAYTLTAAVDPARPTTDTPLMQVALPKPAWVPDAVKGLAAQWAGTDKSPLKRVDNIVTKLATTGYFSHGLESEDPSLPGHSSNRIATLLDKPAHMIGDDEQYAVAAALLLGEAGIPARVVLGFRVGGDSQFSGTTWTVTGSDAHAWIEVPFQGLGWVPFFPTPDKNQEPRAEDSRAKAKPRPQVLQPPPPINASQDDVPQSTPDPRDDKEKEDKPTEVDWGRIAWIVGLSAGPPLIILTPLLIILALKASRTKRRKKTADLAGRMALGWQEVLDRATDLGTIIPPTATRREAGTVLQRVYGAEEATRLANLADRGTFAPVAPTPEQASQLWTGVTGLTASLGHSVSWWRRLTARVSVASLRRHPIPNVAAEEFA